MKAPILFLALLASASPRVELRPLQKSTVLPMGRCEAPVTFRLSLSLADAGGNSCPRVVWQWEDGTLSADDADCSADPGATAPAERVWTRRHTFQRKGSYLIRAHVCDADTLISTVETVAVVTGWEGYLPEKRRSAGCSPAHFQPTLTDPLFSGDWRTGTGLVERPIGAPVAQDRGAPAAEPCLLEPGKERAHSGSTN